MTPREGRLWVSAAIAMLVAGWIHLAIAPAHFAHAPAHGLFFGVLGALQILWLLLLGVAEPLTGRSRTWRQRMFELLRLSGLWLSGGAVMLWLLTQVLRPPFALQPEPIDNPTLLSKLAELAVAAILVRLSPATGAALRAAGGRSSRQVRLSLRRSTLAGAAWAVVAGLAMWGGGLFAEDQLPRLKPAAMTAGTGVVDDGHDHEHDDDTPPPSFGEYVSAASRLVGSLLGPPPVYDWQLPSHFPPPLVPADNPVTAEKVQLGRFLFYDRKLAGNGQQACASCHLQKFAFSDAKATSVGSTGEELPRNSMALVNVVYNPSQTWGHPNLEQLEDQLLIPMFGTHPVELGMAGNEDAILERLRGQPAYQELFPLAFPADADPINMANIVRALASFTRTLISSDSAYDRFVQGDTEALSASARRGMGLFLSEDFECHHCHGGFNFTVAAVHANTAFVEKVFHNTGLYNLGDGAYPHGNQGVFEITQKPEDRGKFRPPSLRNIALTAPYMHDGSIATLEEVIETYAAGGRVIEDGPYAGDGRKNPHKSGFVPGFPMTEQERDDLVAFLHALTDDSFVTDPRYSDPFVQPLPSSATTTQQTRLSEPVDLPSIEAHDGHDAHAATDLSLLADASGVVCRHGECVEVPRL